MFEPDKDFFPKNSTSVFELETEIKKSRFIAELARVESREEALSVVNRAKQRYPDARHHCWAYVIQTGGNQSVASAAMSDDGEPSGTAGKPILNVLQHKNLSQLIVVVSRYFGGIKLGAGGLIRAYGAAAQHVIERVPMIEPVAQSIFTICCEFSQEQNIRYWLSQLEGELVSIRYENSVEMTISVPRVNDETLTAQLNALGATYNLES